MSEPVQFKSIKKRKPLRQRKRSHSDSDEEKDSAGINLEALKETQELQKLRNKTSGVSAITLASGQKISKVEALVADDKDPFKLQTGGLLDLSKAKAAKALEEGNELDPERESMQETLVGTQFSKETRIRDEDEEMKKFIDTEMERRRGLNDKHGPGSEDSWVAPEERALKSLPDHLRKSTFKKNEEMLSSQMLSGIPEVDLGIEEKIRNIEATEEAKKRLAAKAKAKAKPSEFVPNNLAVNFKQPHRFKADKEDKAMMTPSEAKRLKMIENEPAPEAVTVKVGAMPEKRTLAQGLEGDPQANNVGGSDKATDDMHLTKFKQHFQRK